HLPIPIAKIFPIVLLRRPQPVPITFVSSGRAGHALVESGALAHVAQIISVCFMLRQADYLSIAKLAEQSDVAFADRFTQLAFARQTLGIAKEIVGRFAFADAFAKYHAVAFFLFCFYTEAAGELRPKTIDQKPDQPGDRRIDQY